LPSDRRRRSGFAVPLLGALLAPLLAGLLVASASAAQPLRLDGVVILMRHGVRPPTKAQPMAPGVAREAWPTWPVGPGELTPNGARAVRRLGAQDRAFYAARGLAPARACPKAGGVEIWADVDQRTIATGEAWAKGYAPGCALATGRSADKDDLLFSPFAAAAAPLSPEAGLQAVEARLPAGGLEAVAAGQKRRLDRLTAIFGCCAPPICQGEGAAPGCGFGDLLNRLVAPPGGRPKLRGGLDLASTAAQILLLEYADGKPAAEVGWGRASGADVSDLSALHALEFEILARPPAIAAANAGPLARRLLQGLEGPDRRKLLLLVGHDTNVASLAGLLDLHWRIDGYAPDDPAPGGQLGFERLRAADGRLYVRAFYQAQPLAQIRAIAMGAPAGSAVRLILPIPGCRSGPQQTCPLADFSARLRRAAAGSNGPRS
jgi:4-phytase/acid phosphatase